MGISAWETNEGSNSFHALIVRGGGGGIYTVDLAAGTMLSWMSASVSAKLGLGVVMVGYIKLTVNRLKKTIQMVHYTPLSDSFLPYVNGPAWNKTSSLSFTLLIQTLNWCFVSSIASHLAG